MLCKLVKRVGLRSSFNCHAVMCQVLVQGCMSLSACWRTLNCIYITFALLAMGTVDTYARGGVHVPLQLRYRSCGDGFPAQLSLLSQRRGRRRAPRRCSCSKRLSVPSYWAGMGTSCPFTNLRPGSAGFTTKPATCGGRTGGRLVETLPTVPTAALTGFMDNHIPVRQNTRLRMPAKHLEPTAMIGKTCVTVRKFNA